MRNSIHTCFPFTFLLRVWGKKIAIIEVHLWRHHPTQIIGFFKKNNFLSRFCARWQFKLRKQFPIVHTNSDRSNFSIQDLYYSSCFTVFHQGRNDICSLQLSYLIQLRSLTHFKVEWNASWEPGTVEEQTFAPQSQAVVWSVNEICVKVSAVHLFPLLQTWRCGWAICENSLENSVYKIQVRCRLIMSHNSWEIFRLPNGLI